MANGPGPRPKYAPKIEKAHGSLLDSLVSLAGAAPSRIEVAFLAPGVTGDYALGQKSITLAPHAAERRSTMLHEFGHFLSETRPDKFYDFVDSLSLNASDLGTLERFADAFAGAWDRKEKGDSGLLGRLLGLIERKPND